MPRSQSVEEFTEQVGRLYAVFCIFKVRHTIIFFSYPYNILKYTPIKHFDDFFVLIKVILDVPYILCMKLEIYTEIVIFNIIK